MKNSPFQYRFVSAAIGCLLVLAVSAPAGEVVRYKAKPVGNLVRIEGSANVHDWTMEGTLISGYLEVPAGVALDSSQAAIAGAPDGKIKAKAEASIRVTSILNDKYDGMSEVMQQAMDATNFPYIKFSLTEMTLKQPHAAGAPFQFDTKGELSLHGVTNKISMPVSIESLDKRQLKVIGSAIPIKMTDYQVKPPVKLGIFTTAPEIKISFEWVVGLPAAKPAEGK